MRVARFSNKFIEKRVFFYVKILINRFFQILFYNAMNEKMQIKA